jgi:hypothetical protein
VCLQRLRVTWTRPAKITNLAETAVVVRNLFSLLDNKPGEPASLWPCSRNRSCPDSVLLCRKRCKSWSRRACCPNRILVLHTGPGAASTGARDGNIPCLRMRAGGVWLCGRAMAKLAPLYDRNPNTLCRAAGVTMRAPLVQDHVWLSQRCMLCVWGAWCREVPGIAK